MAFTKFVLVLWKQGELEGPHCNDFFQSRYFPGLPQMCCTSPLRVSVASNPSLLPGVQPLKPEHQYLPLLTAEGMQDAWQWSLWWILYILVSKCVLSPLKFQSPNPHPHSWGGFRVWEHFSSLTIPFQGHRSLSWQPLSVSFCIFIFCPTSFWGYWIVILEVWYLLLAFRRCSVDIFQVQRYFWYICGEEGDLPFLFFHYLESHPKCLLLKRGDWLGKNLLNYYDDILEDPDEPRDIRSLNSDETFLPVEEASRLLGIGLSIPTCIAWGNSYGFLGGSGPSRQY